MTDSANVAFEKMARALKEIEDANRQNDPEKRGARLHKAYGKAATAFADVFGDVAMELAAVAFLNKRPFEPEGLNPDLLAMARAGVDIKVEHDRDGAMGCRNAIARLLTDHARLLPEGLASRAARSLYQLNLGDTPPMFKPYRVKGLKPGSSARANALFGLYSRIYYRAGYDGVSLPAAIAAEEQTASDININRVQTNTMHSFAKKHGMQAVLDKARQDGEQDSQNDKPFSPCTAFNFSLQSLMDIHDQN